MIARIARCCCRPSAAVADVPLQICSKLSGYDAAVFRQCRESSQTCGGAARCNLCAFCRQAIACEIDSRSALGEER